VDLDYLEYLKMQKTDFRIIIIQEIKKFYVNNKEEFQKVSELYEIIEREDRMSGHIRKSRNLDVPDHNLLKVSNDIVMVERISKSDKNDIVKLITVEVE
jgi:hypothetical protein